MEVSEDESCQAAPPGNAVYTAVTPGHPAYPGLGGQLANTPYHMQDPHLVTSTPYHGQQEMQPFPQLTPNLYQAEKPYQEYEQGGGRGWEAAGEDLNKSDSEKVLARVLGAGEEAKQEAVEELRAARHELALARAAGSASRGETEQLQRVLADQRRENQILTEEIHQLNTKLASTAADRDNLQADKNETAGAVQALQLQLAQLQTADTALKARQQQDQAVRSLSERHAAELAGVRREADLAVGRARQAELERDRLAAQLSREQELHRLQVLLVLYILYH